MSKWLYGAGLAALLAVTAGAHGDWWIVYSPVIVKYTGQSTYCCFPTKAACEAARAQKLQPADSIGCSGFDSPSAKKNNTQQDKAKAQQQAKEAAAQKAKAEQARKEQEALFNREKSATLHALKGLDDEGGGNDANTLTLKPVPPAGGTALQQLKCGSAWAGAATGAGSAEQARSDAERGAQGAGGIRCPDNIGAVPEPPSPTRVTPQAQFLSELTARQQATQQKSRQADQQIQALEQKAQAKESETARLEQTLADLKLKDASASSGAQESDAQRQAREALAKAKAEREKLQQELARRRHEREQLAQDEQRLQQLQAQYQADPQRAGELMGELQH